MSTIIQQQKKSCQQPRKKMSLLLQGQEAFPYGLYFLSGVCRAKVTVSSVEWSTLKRLKMSLQMSCKVRKNTSAAPDKYCSTWRLNLYSSRLGSIFLGICLCWLLAHHLRGVPCFGPLWASQLSYSCVLWPLRLIIYSLRGRAAGRLCSLLLVFPASLPICLTLISLPEYKKLWAATALRTRAQT